MDASRISLQSLNLKTMLPRGGPKPLPAPPHLDVRRLCAAKVAREGGGVQRGTHHHLQRAGAPRHSCLRNSWDGMTAEIMAGPRMWPEVGYVTQGAVCKQGMRAARLAFCKQSTPASRLAFSPAHQAEVVGPGGTHALQGCVHSK